MATDKTSVFVYADWFGMDVPRLVGTLTAQQAKGRKAFGFEYDKNWIHTDAQRLLDPDINWYSGIQFPNGKENFGVFLDSIPDTWGRKLMQRRAALKSLESGKPALTLSDLDYLMGVHDFTRMGALRFKLDPEGAFLDNDTNTPTPVWAHIRELQYSAEVFESNTDSKIEKKWIDLLIAPGSSLGGARPKANILDEQGELWIAKFPSKNDTTDKASWEYLAYKLACHAGIDMAECRLQHIHGPYKTFFTKRFDRIKSERIHFSSAMNMTGKNEDLIRDLTPSYLDIAEFIQYSGSAIDRDLRQLWRRIIFNISISNTDDHLRNHGFLLDQKGWRLSPAFDLNPSVEKGGLALNIDMDNNKLDFELARSTGAFYHLNKGEMDRIIHEVSIAVSTWRTLAAQLAIPRSEQEYMAPAFAQAG